MALQALTASTGVFAGVGTTISLVCVPAIRASQDPLPAWQVTYNNGKKIALASIIPSTIIGIKKYLDSGADKDYRFLLASGLSSVIVLYTILFMKKTNDSLFAIKHSSRLDEDAKVRSLINKWSKLQLGRTVLGLAAFATTIYITYKR